MLKLRPGTGSGAELDCRRVSPSLTGSQTQFSPHQNTGAQPNNVLHLLPLEEGLGTKGTDLPAWIS